MSEESALKLAGSCDRLVGGLQEVLRLGDGLSNVTGFAALPSGERLKSGFSAKGQECLDTIVAFQEAALWYKAAYLAAAKLFPEADAASRAAIDRVAGDLDGGQ